VHDRKSRVIRRDGRRVSRDHVQIGLRPIQADIFRSHGRDDIEIRQLREVARSCRSTQSAHVDLGVDIEVIHATQSGIRGAIGGIAAPVPSSASVDRAVFVVYDSDRSAGRTRDVRRPAIMRLRL